MTTPARTTRTHLQRIALGATLCLAASVYADDIRNLVEQALDQKITRPIEIAERPIREALAQLEPATGLRFVLDAKAAEWMPYGEQTRIAITLRDVSVRQALTQLFAGMGLQMRVEKDRVLVEPSPVLDRLGRKLTVDEVETLQKLASRSFNQLKPGEIDVQLRLPPEPDPGKLFEEVMRSQPPADGLTQFESATQQAGWLWVPRGKSIVVYSRSEDVQQRLDRPLNVEYQRVPLDELLVDLGKRVDITVHFEPGALKQVSARERLVDLVQRDTTLRQVLELVSGRTGLHYDVVEDGIVIFPVKPEAGATNATSSGGGSGSADPVVAILEVKVDAERSVHLLVRASELPEDLKRLRERELPAFNEAIRKLLAQGGPTTQPAAQPKVPPQPSGPGI